MVQTIVATHHLSLFNKYLCGRVDLWKFIVHLVQVLLLQSVDHTLSTICQNEDPMRQDNRILDPRRQYLIDGKSKMNIQFSI